MLLPFTSEMHLFLHFETFSKFWSNWNFPSLEWQRSTSSTGTVSYSSAPTPFATLCHAYLQWVTWKEKHAEVQNRSGEPVLKMHLLFLPLSPFPSLFISEWLTPNLHCGYVKIGETNLISSLKMILELQMTSVQDNDGEVFGWFMWFGLVQDNLAISTKSCKCTFNTFAIFQRQFSLF